MQPQSKSELYMLARITSNAQAHIGRAAMILDAHGISEQWATAEHLGVATEMPDAYAYLNGWLTIPYLVRGSVRGIKFRCAEDHDHKEHGHGKYHSLGRTRIYGVDNLATDSSTFAICEGELDALVMTHALNIPAIGIPGVSAWHDHFDLLVDDYEDVIVVGDGDEPGREFSKRLAGRIRNAREVHVSNSKDVSECYALSGREYLQELIHGSRPVADHQVA